MPYPERRFITIGLLHDRMVVVVWTPRHQGRRIISMRKANGRERPKSANPKVAISLRIPPDVLARWKSTGAGWQTRMVEALTRDAPRG